MKVGIILLVLVISNISRCGTLTVVSEPTNALVYLDNKIVGFTPIVITQINPGVYKIKVYKEGYIEDLETIVYRGGDYIHQVRLYTQKRNLPLNIPYAILSPTSYVLKKDSLFLKLTKEKGFLVAIGIPAGITHIGLYQYGIAVHHKISRFFSMYISFEFIDDSIEGAIGCVRGYNLSGLNSLLNVGAEAKYKKEKHYFSYYLSVQSYIFEYLDSLIEFSKEKYGIRIAFLIKSNKKINIICSILPKIDIGVIIKGGNEWK